MMLMDILTCHLCRTPERPLWSRVLGQPAFIRHGKRYVGQVVHLLPQLDLVGHMCEELVQLDAALPVRVHVLQQVLYLVVRREHSWLGPFLICRWQRCLLRCVRNCSTNGSHEVAQLCTRDWTVAMSIKLSVVWRQESMWMLPSHGYINLNTPLILIYLLHLNTVVNISLVSGAKESVSAPISPFSVSVKFSQKNAWVKLGDFLGFPETPFNSLSLCRLYVSRCQVSSPRSMALNSGDQPSVLLIPPTKHPSISMVSTLKLVDWGFFSTTLDSTLW